MRRLIVRGPGLRGPGGRDGLDGVNGVENDTAVAGYINNSASSTSSALADMIANVTDWIEVDVTTLQIDVSELDAQVAGLTTAGTLTVGGAWSASPGTYAARTLVTYLGGVYVSNAATVAGDVPGASSKWTAFPAFMSYGLALGTADLDTITTTGLYLQTSSANVTDAAAQHYPSAVFATDAAAVGILRVTAGPSGSYVQEWMQAGTSTRVEHSTFRRDKKANGSAWTTWVKVARPLTELPTGGTAMLRDSAGRSQVAAPSAIGDVANKSYVDGRSTGTSIGAIDLDTLTSAGVYVQGQSANVTDAAAQHYPMALFPDDANQHGVITVYTSLNGGIVQEWRQLGSTSKVEYSSFRRDKKTTGNSWTPWVKIARPLASAATVNTTVLRDGAGRAQIATPNVAADIANKGYVDSVIATGGTTSGKTADLYPVRITKTNLYTDIVPVSGALTAVDLYALSATDRRKYLSQTPAQLTFSGKDVLVGSVGMWSVGITTDASEILFKGYVGSINETYVLVNGERVTMEREFQGPANTSEWGAVCLRFDDGNPVRDVEIFGSWGWRSIEYNSDATVANPYTRAIPGKKTVGIFGDSWMDGTARARPSVKVRLATDRRWNVIESARGGTGYTVSSAQGGPYTDAGRLGVMAALDAEYLPDICVLWGSTNDNAASGAAVATAAKTVIDTLLAVRPSMKFLITGTQAAGAVHEEQTTALEALAATYGAGVVTVSDFMDAFPTYAMKNTAVSDNHPSHDAVRTIAAWLSERIVSIVGPVY